MRSASIATIASPLRHAVRQTASSRRSFATSIRRDARYGFIGLGQMGYPMAHNLRTKIPESDSLIIHDVNSESLERFKKEVGNVEIAKSVREVAEKSETIVTVLPEPKHVESVFQQMLEPSTLLSEAEVTSERLFIDCSTIDVRSSAKVADATHSSKQGKFVDAPMSGGVVGATAGGLTFMVGAADDVIGRVEEVLNLMGKRVVHLGPQTSGLKGKLANNYLLALTNIATAEAMNMGIRWGIDGKVLADLINSATGKCWPSESYNPVPGVLPNAPASKGYKGGFGTALMLKDLNLALQASAEANIVPLLGAYAKQIYMAVEGNADLKGHDFSVVYKYLGGLEEPPKQE